MANDVKVKRIPIVLDKERHLVFDLNAFCELEEKFGSTSAAFEVLQDGSMKGIRTMLWAGLVHEDESLTEKEVGKLVSFSNIQVLADKITEAMSEGMPEAKN
ncbi:hypothetical protein [Aneurinibacillus aneurinilyticus]|uniref:Phage XkdN-like protein n=1 Tax=Aneurinibacillus aneurinilyticus ATCC 12856 TaxID=649747 RepID=U1YJD6_ANEAE|nr:hypothetical protein [Aneurinibacillus aneurinilyticus]ERI10891.1 hypothetical protein HMPREF0083_01003 [Aneurinibacillus aneurinilyticus ATCC 12856]MED0672034.1 hypothetical protein [Aneurinibacillus aneurinilyticus]MED0704951.1 hypothetical protein [Aneurinibacillus aneurinilyticus]MED0723091.1 hypothetical protein [Aneurinibacillus aneurinilyticus]MED0731472.1 hypothetical protein [Aneurinibacillus aneurinilyticus]